MADLIPDGIYQILNVQYATYAVDLVAADPLGTVSGLQSNEGSPEQKWKVKNLGGNQITIQSNATPNTYAGVYTLVNGVVLAGSPNATIWFVNNLGGQKFELETVGGKFHWVLPAGKNYATIKLGPVSGSPQANAQWTFTKSP